jgi:hypothetical protein
MSANFDSNVALVSTTSMTTYLGIALGSTEESECDLLINAASRLAVDYTGRGMDTNGVSRLLSTSRTEYYDGDGTDTLYVKAYPISAVTSIYVDPDRDYTSSDLLDTDDYVYYENDGKICTDGALFTGGRKSVKVTYTGGYTSVPADLQQAVKELVLFWYKRNTDKRVGGASMSVGDKSISYETDIPDSVKSTFKRYRYWAAGVA